MNGFNIKVDLSVTDSLRFQPEDDPETVSPQFWPSTEEMTSSHKLATYALNLAFGDDTRTVSWDTLQTSQKVQPSQILTEVNAAWLSIF